MQQAQKRPETPAPQPADPARHGAASLIDHPQAATQRAIAGDLDGSARVAQLAAMSAAINAAPSSPAMHAAALSGRVIQRMMNDDEDPPALQEEQAADQHQMVDDGHQGQVAENVQPAQPPEFDVGAITFSSWAGDHLADGSDRPPADRSIYFDNGRRIRLAHPSGPHISEAPMARHTFRQKPGSADFYGKSDYKNLPKDATGTRDPSGIMKPAEAGDPGKLFEIGANGRTHPSRGKPVAETGIADQAHLDRIVGAARAADGELPPLRAQADASKTETDRHERRRTRQRDRTQHAKTRLDAAADHEKAPLQTEYDTRRAEYVTRREAHRQARAQAGAHAANLQQRVDHHNNQIRLAYANAPQDGGNADD